MLFCGSQVPLQDQGTHSFPWECWPLGAHKVPFPRNWPWPKGATSAKVTPPFVGAAHSHKWLQRPGPLTLIKNKDYLSSRPCCGINGGFCCKHIVTQVLSLPRAASLPLTQVSLPRAKLNQYFLPISLSESVSGKPSPRQLHFPLDPLPQDVGNFCGGYKVVPRQVFLRTCQYHPCLYKNQKREGQDLLSRVDLSYKLHYIFFLKPFHYFFSIFKLCLKCVLGIRIFLFTYFLVSHKYHPKQLTYSDKPTWFLLKHMQLLVSYHLIPVIMSVIRKAKDLISDYSMVIGCKVHTKLNCFPIYQQ